MLVSCLLLLFFQISIADSNRNNVCRTFGDYATMDTNRNCWHNPDVRSSTPIIAKRYGYTLKKYKVTTKDGYVLTLFRIPHNNTDLHSKRQPVLLQHGIGARAIFWMLQGQQSLAFFLVNNGYDVWMSTIRGAGYSRQHEILTVEDPLYWNFSLHEVATYDLPAIIETISRTTAQKGNIIYVGHSMGTTISYIYSTAKKEHADAHLKAIISLAPVAYMKNIQGLLRSMAMLSDPAMVTLKNLGIYYLGDMPAINHLISVFCGTYPSIMQCAVITLLATGMAPRQVKADMFPVFSSYFPSGTSLKVIQHFTQIIQNGGEFRYYDRGPENMATYNSMTPPVYDVRNISLPVHLFIGKKDVLGNVNDAEILYQKLNSQKSKTKAKKYYFDLAHNDFYLGGDVGELQAALLDVMKNKIGTNYTYIMCFIYCTIPNKYKLQQFAGLDLKSVDIYQTWIFIKLNFGQ